MVKDFSKNMAKQLAIVEIEGRQYFADERLKEYRAIDNPHHRIDFDNLGERKVKVLSEEQELQQKKQKRSRGL